MKKFQINEQTDFEAQDLIDLKSQIDRRQFLKRTAFVTGAISTTVLSADLLAQNYSRKPVLERTNNSMCEFSALDPEFAYLNSGTEGSMPHCVLEQLTKSQQQWASDPTSSYETSKALGKHQHDGRLEVAESLAVSKNNICLTDNTTMGMNMVLMGINFKSTDKVILTNHEHNAIISPLAVQQNKLTLKLIKRDFPPAIKLSKMSAQEVIEHLFPNINELKGAKALCVSHVYPTTGIRLPLDLLRKKADELGVQYLVVDGAQAFGMIDLSKGQDRISNADFYACPGHKWLNGPPGTGILYIKNEKIQPPEFYPIMSQRMSKYSFNGKIIKSDFPMSEALQVRGCSNAPGFVAMRKAIEFQQNFGGYAKVQKQILDMSDQVKALVKKQSDKALVSPYNDKDATSGLTVFFPFSWSHPDKIFTDKKTAAGVVDKLLKKNIQIRFIGFKDPSDSKNKLYALRVSTGIFNDEKQINLLMDNLKKILSKL